MRWQLIESDDALRTLLSNAAGCQAVIVDTEFMRRNTFYPQVALLQLCFPCDDASSEMAWLVDPLALSDPGPLAALLTDPAVVKVVHSGSEDLEVFQRWLGVLPQPLFDTQRAAALLNIGFGLGYGALVQQLCNVDLPKGETRSDWLQRPLTASQCEYAAQDVTWLVPVWRELHARCVSQDKLDWVLEDGRDATRALGTEVYDFQKRIKSAWKLDRRQLGILAAVCRWREDTARSRDKPRGWIIDDETCFRLAVEDPGSLPALDAKLGLPSSVVRRHGEALVELLATQRTVPDSALPQTLPAPLNAAQRQQVKALKASLSEIAKGLSAAPEVLAQSKDCELLLRQAQGETIEQPAYWQGWREALVFAPLRELLAAGGR
jgi:ribonuclease D